MKGIKNLKIRKTALITLIASSLAITGCSKSRLTGTANLSSVSFQELMANDDIKCITIADELIEENKLLYNDDDTIFDAADKLEKYLNIIDKINGFNFVGAESLESLDEQTKEEAKNYSLEEINNLIAFAKTKDNDLVSLEKKIDATKKLFYLQNYCKEWIMDNGQRISEQLLKTTVKCSVGAELNYSCNDYNCIFIPPRNEIPSDGGFYCIDTNNGRYRVKSNAKEIYNSIGYIYDIQMSSFSEKSKNNLYDTCRKALQYSKTTMAAGCEIKKDKIVEHNNACEIEKQFIRK